MTSANLTDLHALLFEHPPSTLARLSGLSETLLAAACAQAVSGALLDYAAEIASEPAVLQPPAGAAIPIGTLLTVAMEVVRLEAGVYRGTVSVGPGRTLRLVGDGQVLLYATGAPCVQVAAGGRLEVEGVRLLHLPGPEESDAIEVAAGGEVRLEQVRVRTTRGRTGVRCSGAGARLVAAVCQISGGSVGVLLGAGGTGTLTGCTLEGQRVAAVMLSGEAEATMEGGQIHGAAAAVVARRGARARVRQVQVTGAARVAFLVEEGAALELQGGEIDRVGGVPIRVGWQGQLQASGVRVGAQRGGPAVLVLGQGSAMLQRCTVAPTAEGPGVLVDSGGTLIDQQSTLGRVASLSGARIEHYGSDRQAVVVVDAGGGGDCTTLQAALQRVDYGGTLRLRPGVYRESLVLDVAVRIEAEGAGVCWESAETCLTVSAAEVQVIGVTFQGRLDRRRHDLVVVHGGRLVMTGVCMLDASQTALKVRGGAVVARDLRIERPGEAAVVVDDGGTALLEDGVLVQARLSCVHARKGGQLTLRRCRVVDSRQGGLFVYEGGRLLAEDCEISGSHLAGLEVRQRGEATLRGCRILRGEAGAVYVHTHSTLTLEGCDVISNGRNLKPAIEARSSGHVVVSRCRIRGSHRAVRTAQAGTIELIDSDLAGNLNLMDREAPTSVVLHRCRRGRSRVKHQTLLEGHDGPGARWAVPAAGAFLAGERLRDLRGGDLTDAFLVGADLQGADLREARLEGACLVGADLRGADLRGAVVEGADLRGALLADARLEGVDLSGVVS